MDVVFDLCYESHMLNKVKRLLESFTKIIMDTIHQSNFKQTYYIVAKFYIFQLGLTCDPDYPMLPNITKYNFQWLLRDIQNTLNTTITEQNIAPKFQSLVKYVRSDLEKYKQNKYTCQNTIMYNEKDNLMINTNGDRIEVPPNLYTKLVNTYNGPQEQMLDIIYSTIRRYEIFGQKKESISLSANFIYNNKKILNKVKLDLEMFGSPINRNLDKYFSLFYDIEKYFGSLGSIFCVSDTDPIWTENKYIVSNPPYDEIIMEEMAKKVIRILSQENENCFILTIPDWRPSGQYINTPYTSYDILTTSKYHKMTIVKDQIKYYDYFKDKQQDIGKTDTIILVVSNFNVPLVESDFISEI